MEDSLEGLQPLPPIVYGEVVLFESTGSPNNI